MINDENNSMLNGLTEEQKIIARRWAKQQASMTALIKKAEANPEQYQQPILDNTLREIQKDWPVECEHNKIIKDNNCNECEKIHAILQYNWCGF